MKQSMAIMTKVNTFFSPNKVMLGNGIVAQAGIEAGKLGATKALIVTDAGVVEAGLVQGLEESLKVQKINFGVYSQVKAEPEARIVDECVKVVCADGYDIMIGIGGGISLDVAKGAAIMATNEGKIVDYSGTDLVPLRGLPKILIPTTAGTGSEVTRAIIITDDSDNSKKAVFSDFALPDVAIVDPLLTLSMPLAVTADTGIDALVHAVETYVSVKATPFSDVLAIEAISLIAENLPVAYVRGDNIEARFNMSLAATLAGMAFTSGGLGAVHALAYPLDTEFHLSHGRSNAVMLPYVVDYNKIGNLSKYADIAEVMGEDMEGLSEYEAAESLVGCLFRLIEDVAIPTRLSDYGVSRDDIPKLAAGGMKQKRLFVPNPRNLTEEDVNNIYESAF